MDSLGLVWWSFGQDRKLGPAGVHQKRLRRAEQRKGRKKKRKEKSPISIKGQQNTKTHVQDLIKSDFPADLLICCRCRANWTHPVGADKKVIAQVPTVGMRSEFLGCQISWLFNFSLGDLSSTFKTQLGKITSPSRQLHLWMAEALCWCATLTAIC